MYFEKSKTTIEIERNRFEMICLDWLVPENHLLRRIESVIDFSFIHDLTKDYYSMDNGRPCLDTVILFKIPLLNYLMGNNSIRKTLEETKVNMAYRWFLNIGLNEDVPNYSTFSQNYHRRFYDSDVFDKIFVSILTKIVEKGLIDEKTIFVDGTHIKANANKHKSIKRQVKVIADEYKRALETEINEFRELNGRKPYDDNDDDDDDSNIEIDDLTGEIIKKEVQEKEQTTTITESITDPESGMFVKGEHERQFAYVDQVACDRHGWVLGYSVNPANMHDSKAFLPFFYEELLKYNPTTICADAGYVSGLIAYNVQSQGINFLTPYVSPKGRSQEFSKSCFDYYMEIDAYMCPNHKLLVPWNITKDGYIEYKINRSECASCPYATRCIKNYGFKTIRRNLYEDCLEKAREYRLSNEGKEIYKLRKETIERVFAEGKEKHCLRFTRYRGLKKNRDMRALLYACLNIKKLTNLMTRLVSNTNNIELAVE